MGEVVFRSIVFVVGAIVGSFLNVCIARLPKEESIVMPASHCPYCDTHIRPYDNIPIISYFLLRGRCRDCELPISMRYPIIEVLTALIFVLLSFYFKGALLAAYAVFASGLIVASAVDFGHEIIPDQISIGGIPAGIALSTVLPSLQGAATPLEGLRYSCYGACLGAALIYGIGFLGKIMFRKEAMGFGDVKFMAAIGAFLGMQKVTLVFFLAPCLGISYGIFARLKYKKEYIPYGPFLSLAAFISVFIKVDLMYMCGRFS